jgi:hypothetical protein
VNLVHLEPVLRKDIGVILRHLLSRFERGELRALAVCAKDTSNQEDICLAGIYRDVPAFAAAAAMKMSRRINDMDDSI